MGGELREIHLMKDPVLEKSPVTYPAPGDNVITRKLTKTSPGWEPDEGGETGKVHVNDDQYFARLGVLHRRLAARPKMDQGRKGRALDIEDVQHYRKIVKALLETERLMGEVDGILRLLSE